MGFRTEDTLRTSLTVQHRMASNWGKATTKELRRELERLGLSTAGGKQELYQRLEASLVASAIDSPAPGEPGEIAEELTEPPFVPEEVPEHPQLRAQPPAKVSPRHYDGLSSWRSYLGLFERVARINQWTEVQKLDYLWIHLSGEALRFVDSLTTHQADTYSKVCDQLESRFGDTNLIESFRSELRMRRRKPGESLPALAQEILHLVRGACPEIGLQGVEELAIEKFREALPDHEQRMSVYRSKATTLQQAVQVAMDTASWQESEHRRNPSTARARGVSVEQELTSDGEEHVARVGVNTVWTQQLIQVLQNLVDSEGKPATERKATPRYFYCHRLGHVQKDCRKKKTSERQQGNDKRQH